MEYRNYPCVETCPLGRTMAFTGGKWKVQILCPLHSNDPTHYDRLKKTLDGVSNAMLADILWKLKGDGSVHRQEYLEVPIRVEYAITESYRQLISISDALDDWSTALWT